MSILILGTIIFFGIHLVPATPLKAAIVVRSGTGPFKGIFSLFAALGLGLIIYGLGQANLTTLWIPPSWSRILLIAIMPIVIVLLVAAEMPNNIRRLVRHPMLIGVTIWGCGHLVANGDLATSILFASFSLFSIINILMVNARENYQPREAVSPYWDLAVVSIGLVLYGVIFYFHGAITGMPLR